MTAVKNFEMKTANNCDICKTVPYDILLDRLPASSVSSESEELELEDVSSVLSSAPLESGQQTRQTCVKHVSDGFSMNSSDVLNVLSLAIQQPPLILCKRLQRLFTCTTIYSASL
eukprot:s605_g23.t1